MKALTVLVVEDDQALRLFYQLALAERGYAVSAVANGAEAIKALTPEIDLLVTDLNMPLVPGDKLITTLRERPEYRELPILVVTAHPSDLRPELRNDKTNVLRKPFELPDFVRWVDETARLKPRDN